MSRIPTILAEALPSPEAVTWAHSKWALLESYFAPECRPFLPSPEQPKPVLVACSGGCDSVALLCLLFRLLNPQERRLLEVVHVHHGLRGREADADANWVQAAAEALGLKFYLHRLEPRDRNLAEAELRQYRFRAIENQLRRSGSDTVFLGHHLNDVAEGMLLALGRGAGLSGLSSPRPVQCIGTSLTHSYSRLHPLLRATRSLMESVLSSSGIGWCVDRSNDSDTFVRNRIRKHVLPVWEAAMPQTVLANVNASRELLEEVDDGLDQLLNQFLPGDDVTQQMDAAALRGQPRMLWRRAFYRWANGVHPELEPRRSLVDGLLEDWMNGGSTHREQAGLHFFVEGYRLWSERVGIPESAPSWDPVGMSVPGYLALPGGASLEAEVVPGNEAWRLVELKSVDCRTEAFVRKPEKGLQVGRWRPGDRMHSLGAPGSRKLQDIFTDRRIPQADRHRLPVVRDADSDEILWVPGLAPADAWQIVADCKWALKLTYADHCTA